MRPSEPITRRWSGPLLSAALMLPAAIASPALAQGDGSTGNARAERGRHIPIPVSFDQVLNVRINVSTGEVEQEIVRSDDPVIPDAPQPASAGPAQGSGCSDVTVTHSDADFGGGEYIVQAGFVENEIAAASYTLEPVEFPAQFVSAEMVFATSNSQVETTTEWSLQIWDGDPGSGILVEEVSSDGDIIPHIVIPPGTNGVNVLLEVDPGDPDQIFINNDSGTGRISVGYRIDVHNDQEGTGCISAPPAASNAFPTTDTDGSQPDEPNMNWLFAIDCGPFGCAAGWNTFGQLPGLCTPSGDWNIRMTYAPFDCAPTLGACCLPNGNCIDGITGEECGALNGDFSPEDACEDVECLAPTAACCFEQSGGCLDVDEQSCIDAGGIPQGMGSACADTVCFPEGACCLPDGSCAGGVSPEDCTGMDGVFQGDGTDCAGIDCPDPVGACCIESTGNCLEFTEAQCGVAGGAWQGIGSSCADDPCEDPDECPIDLDGSGSIDSGDLNLVLGSFGTGDAGDIDGDGVTDSTDLNLVLGEFGNDCD